MNNIKPYHTFFLGAAVGAVAYHLYQKKVKA